MIELSHELVAYIGAVQSKAAPYSGGSVAPKKGGKAVKSTLVAYEPRSGGHAPAFRRLLQHGDRFEHGEAPHLRSPKVTEAPLEMPRHRLGWVAFRRAGEMHEPDRLLGRAPTRPRHARHGHGELRSRPRQRAFGHGPRHALAHGSVPPDER